VAPVLVLLSYVIGPKPMDLRFWPDAVAMMLVAGLVRRGSGPDGLSDLRHDAVPSAAGLTVNGSLVEQN
jgi:hypothetical protein